MDDASEHPVLKNYYKDIIKANLVFQMDGSYSYIHDVPEIKAEWERHLRGKLPNMRQIAW